MKLTKQQLKQIIKEELQRLEEFDLPDALRPGGDWAEKSKALGAAEMRGQATVGGGETMEEVLKELNLLRKRVSVLEQVVKNIGGGDKELKGPRGRFSQETVKGWENK